MVMIIKLRQRPVIGKNPSAQRFGVFNLLNTFKVGADGSAGFQIKQMNPLRAALRERRPRRET